MTTTSSYDVLTQLARTIASRKPENGGDAQASYVAKLFAKAPDAALKKVAEEAGEFVMASKDADHADYSAQARAKMIYEAADLWFHTLVALSHAGIEPHEVLSELARREGLSGLTEKANRQPD